MNREQYDCPIETKYRVVLVAISYSIIILLVVAVTQTNLADLRGQQGFKIFDVCPLMEMRCTPVCCCNFSEQHVGSRVLATKIFLCFLMLMAGLANACVYCCKKLIKH